MNNGAAHMARKSAKSSVLWFRAELRRIAPLVGILVLSACNQSEQQAVIESADLVLTGAKVYTVDTTQPWAEAVAIKDGRFLYVGDAAGVDKYIGNNTTVSNLAGRFVMPGLIDSHTHPGMMGIEQFGP
jgi:adenine deaminase